MNSELGFNKPQSSRLGRKPTVPFSRSLKQISRIPQHLFSGKRGTKLIALPESRRKLKKELTQACLLGSTNDQKQIYLLDQATCPVMMREIGRLREISFRAVGEGTGKARDIDSYDVYYQQIVLWDLELDEVIGAYRIAEGKTVIAQHGTQGFYTHSLFTLKPELVEQLEQGVELGRSFIQPKYWGKRNLDYLWMGIGAYLNAKPQIRYLFGPVSMPDQYPSAAKSLITHYYQSHFASQHTLATARTPYINPQENPFSGLDKQLEMRQLREQLKPLKVSIPALYKHYVDLCEPEGVTVLAYNIDPDFNNCIDAFMLVDRQLIKQKKAARYIHRHQPLQQVAGFNF